MSRKMVYGLVAAGAVAGGVAFGIGKMRGGESAPVVLFGGKAPVGVNRPGPVGAVMPGVASPGISGALQSPSSAGAGSPSAAVVAKIGPPPKPPAVPTKASIEAYREEMTRYRRHAAEAEGRLPAFERAEQERQAQEAARDAQDEKFRKVHEARATDREKERAAIKSGRKTLPDLKKFPDIAVRAPDPNPRK